MAKDFLTGGTAKHMKVNSLKTKSKVRGSLFGQKESDMKEVGTIIKNMELAQFTSIIKSAEVSGIMASELNGLAMRLKLIMILISEQTKLYKSSRNMTKATI